MSMLQLYGIMFRVARMSERVEKLKTRTDISPVLSAFTRNVDVRTYLVRWIPDHIFQITFSIGFLYELRTEPDMILTILSHLPFITPSVDFAYMMFILFILSDFIIFFGLKLSRMKKAIECLLLLIIPNYFLVGTIGLMVVLKLFFHFFVFSMIDIILRKYGIGTSLLWVFLFLCIFREVVHFMNRSE
ncbi:hypothetical protein [Paenibacillus periandrae]|uniref:hypothetical protein n=1 Tax=Paenibacillus periandrae TaxID=1761741 RepID=UPI001F09AC5D|nr:hypothetical protein [Paenibacillus periandrae]